MALVCRLLFYHQTLGDLKRVINCERGVASVANCAYPLRYLGSRSSLDLTQWCPVVGREPRPSDESWLSLGHDELYSASASPVAVVSWFVTKRKILGLSLQVFSPITPVIMINLAVTSMDGVVVNTLPDCSQIRIRTSTSYFVSTSSCPFCMITSSLSTSRECWWSPLRFLQAAGWNQATPLWQCLPQMLRLPCSGFNYRRMRRIFHNLVSQFHAVRWRPQGWHLRLCQDPAAL